MQCPNCDDVKLRQRLSKRGVLVDVCNQCQGFWLDRGVVYSFSDDPQALEDRLAEGLQGAQPSARLCPRCDGRLDHGRLPVREVEAEQCPRCGGLWIDADQRDRAAAPGADQLDLTLPDEEPAPEQLPDLADRQAHKEAHARLRKIATGMLALPNLFLRSATLLLVLYGLLGLLLVTLATLHVIGPFVALAIGVVIVALQYLLGPWVTDLVLRWAYRFSWVAPDELPEHLQDFVEGVCREHGLKFPSFGIIHDGAPSSMSYGHFPGNARLVISEGILDLLEPEEVEAVVAHELGHIRNWDMVLITLANLVPLAAYVAYRVALNLAAGRNKDGAYGWVIAIGGYVVYIVSEYIVLWFNRTRDYFADRFAGTVTRNPNAMASALIKIAYGLAAQGGPPSKDKKKAEKEKQRREYAGALRALNIFDDRAAVSLVMASAGGTATDPRKPDVEQAKGAMQWDLWNPWAKWYELNSTHPLVANRLLYLTDQAAHQGQEPLVVFDRKKPESYWDDFFVDVGVMLLPWLALLLGFGAAFGVSLAVTGGVVTGKALAFGAGVGLLVAGIASIVKTNFVYRRDFFPHLSIAALLHKVKVSAVRPVPVTLSGTIIGKGVPGLIWSEDFVMQDRTGILFMDYRQPLALWDFLFGLFRAGKYQGKEVRVSGWFRRAPVPFLEVNRVEVLDRSLPPRRCYSLHARLIAAGLLAVVGVAVGVLALVVR